MGKSWLDIWMYISKDTEIEEKCPFPKTIQSVIYNYFRWKMILCKTVSMKLHIKKKMRGMSKIQLFYTHTHTHNKKKKIQSKQKTVFL